MADQNSASSSVSETSKGEGSGQSASSDKDKPQGGTEADGETFDDFYKEVSTLKMTIFEL